MNIKRIVILNLFLILTAAWAWAGEVFIVVSANKSNACLMKADNSEITQYLLTPKETEQALSHYFHSEANPDLYDAAIGNAGLKFCGVGEKQSIIKFLVQSLNEQKIDKRVYEVILNYSQGNLMLQEIDRVLAKKNIPAPYRAHLTKARTLIKESKND